MVLLVTMRHNVTHMHACGVPISTEQHTEQHVSEPPVLQMRCLALGKTSIAPRRIRMSSATRGVVFIHSTPTALCPHITWALESALGRDVTLEWTEQPIGPSLRRAEFSWTGAPGTGAALASALRGWEGVRYEVTEEPSPGLDGSRWSHTPSLGIHHATISASGDTVIHENRLREVLTLAQGADEAVEDMLDELLGTEWDAELEPFRHAGEGAPVRWLHKVG